MASEPLERIPPPAVSTRGLPNRVLRVGELSVLAADLGTISRELVNANDTYTAASEDIPFKDLSTGLKHFATKWDDTREKMQKGVDELHQTVDAVSSSFAEIDRKMGLALSDPSAFDREMYHDLVNAGDYAAANTHKQEWEAREAQREQERNARDASRAQESGQI